MSKIKLVVADVDGTLLNDKKELTAATVDAVDALHAKGIRFALASARPPRGLETLMRKLEVTSPVAAFNGGMLVTSAMNIMQRHPVTVHAGDVGEYLDRFDLDTWAYSGTSWYVLAGDSGVMLDYERECVGFDPVTVDSWDELAYHEFVKFVGVSDAPEQVTKAALRMREKFPELSAAQSTPFYLDITGHGVNKGEAVKAIARMHGVPLTDTAVIGDGGVDVPMFGTAGLAIAMGNADYSVRKEATVTTLSNEQDGFAHAMWGYALLR